MTLEGRDWEGCRWLIDSCFEADPDTLATSHSKCSLWSSSLTTVYQPFLSYLVTKSGRRSSPRAERKSSWTSFRTSHSPLRRADSATRRWASSRSLDEIWVLFYQTAVVLLGFPVPDAVECEDEDHFLQSTVVDFGVSGARSASVLDPRSWKACPA